MEYEEALENDHRKFHTIYWSILRREHLVIYTLHALFHQKKRKHLNTYQ